MNTDAYAPAEIAKRADAVAIAKGQMPFVPLTMLAILAGAFIAFGALSYTLVVADSNLGTGPTRLLGGAAFSVGLILVIIGGAELFTGNALMVLALMDRKISVGSLSRNWTIVYLGNFVGSLGMAFMVMQAGVMEGQVAEAAAAIAQNKLALSLSEGFFRGVLCNILVCLAVWMSLAARRVTGKILVILFPVAAFVSIGFEHSIANMYVIPVAMMEGLIDVDLVGFAHNLLFVTLGNIFGGGVLVGMVYWAVYLLPRNTPTNKA